MHTPTLPRLRKRFAIDWWGHHGVRHWARVRRNARIIALHVPGVDTQVTDWFAILHDAWRQDEHEDPGHGWRAMAWVRKMHDEDMLGLDAWQFQQLLVAIEHHSDPSASAYNETIAACWNADRYDLGRVGITPQESRLAPKAMLPRAIWWPLHLSAVAEHNKQRSLYANANLLPN